jgi:hypothetical protein
VEKEGNEKVVHGREGENLLHLAHENDIDLEGTLQNPLVPSLSILLRRMRRLIGVLHVSCDIGAEGLRALARALHRRGGHARLGLWLNSHISARMSGQTRARA